MTGFSDQPRAQRTPTLPRHRPRHANSRRILFKIDRASRHAGLILARHDLWVTCLFAALASLSWLGLGMVLFGQPLSAAVALDCRSAIECALRGLDALP